MLHHPHFSSEIPVKTSKNNTWRVLARALHIFFFFSSTQASSSNYWREDTSIISQTCHTPKCLVHKPFWSNSITFLCAFRKIISTSPMMSVSMYPNWKYWSLIWEGCVLKTINSPSHLLKVSNPSEYLLDVLILLTPHLWCVPLFRQWQTTQCKPS